MIPYCVEEAGGGVPGGSQMSRMDACIALSALAVHRRVPVLSALKRL